MTSLQTTLLSQAKDSELLEKAKRASEDYLRERGNGPVYPDETRLADLQVFDTPLPESPQDPHVMLDLLIEKGAPATVHHSGGRYFGFVNGGLLPSTLAARWVADTWDQNAALFVMSPIAAKLEQVAQNWLVSLLGLPPESVAGLVGGTSTATLCGLVAARNHLLKKLGHDVTAEGLFGAPNLRVIMGTQTHGTVKKALSILGFGEAHIEWVDADAQGRMRADALPSLDERCIVVLQAGNVNSGAFDNFSLLCKAANEAGAWVHVDGAFGLWAAASSQFNPLTQGVQLADSWSVDGHKTLNTPYDNGIIICRHAEALTNALHQQGSYIQLSEQRDSMLYTPDMSRRARGIDLWAAMYTLGKTGIAGLMEQFHGLAVYLGGQLEKCGIAPLNDIVFNQVIIQGIDDAHTMRILATVQQSGDVWCGGANWMGSAVIRLSVCSWQTTQADIDTLVSTLAACYQQTPAD